MMMMTSALLDAPTTPSTFPPPAMPNLHGASLARPLTLQWHEHQYPTKDGLWLTYNVALPQHPTPTGRACLFFMGLGGSNFVARPFFEALAPKYDVIIAVDLRGFGQHRFAFDSLHSFKQLWDDANALIQHLQQHLANSTFQSQHKHPLEWSLMGLSLGGLLATLLAKQHPQQFQRVCLLAPAFKPNPKRFPPQFILRTLWQFIQGKLPIMTLPYGLDAITRQPEAVIQTFSAHWPEFATHANKPVQQPTRFMLSVLPFQWLAHWQFKQLPQPVCLVVPEQDSVIDSHTSVTLFSHMSWPAWGRHQLLLYPACYHDVILEPEFEAIAQDIHQWLLLT